MVNLNLITAPLLNTGLIPVMTGMIMENAVPVDTVKTLAVVAAEITEMQAEETTEMQAPDEITEVAAGITITGVATVITGVATVITEVATVTTETITAILRRGINNYTN